MPNELYVSVPADLAWELDQDGIEEVARVRGIEWLAQSAAIAITATGAAANVTTVLLAKDSIARFVHRFAGWAGRKGQSESESSFTVCVQSRHGTQGAEEQLSVKLSASGPLTESDRARIVSLLEASFAEQSKESG
jgi:hypothetical protein